jgi:hypothetical protein
MRGFSVAGRAFGYLNTLPELILDCNTRRRICFLKPTLLSDYQPHFYNHGSEKTEGIALCIMSGLFIVFFEQGFFIYLFNSENTFLFDKRKRSNYSLISLLSTQSQFTPYFPLPYIETTQGP